MPTSSAPLPIRIFLSSPGDVADERGLALKVIREAAGDHLLRDRVILKPIAWDDLSSRTPMLVTMTPQKAIDSGLPRPSECDIVVVILWARMGTPLPFPEYRKVNGEPYNSGTEWEYEDAVQAARNTGRPQVVLYRRMEEPVIKLTDPQRTDKITQWERVEAFFATFRDAKTGAILQGHNTYQTPAEFEQFFENDLKVLIEKRIGKPMEPVTKRATWTGSPFPGLRAFTPDDAPIFFGRGRETAELIRRVKDSRFVAVVGASGSGKSSLVGAGLIPRLRDNAISGDHLGSKDWRLVSFKPGEAHGQPFEALYNALLQTFPVLCPDPLDASEVKRRFLTELEQNPAVLADTWTAALAGSPAWAEVLLFIDQFEELFTVVTDVTVRRAFVAMLAHNAHADRLRMVVTLRADFYHRCVELDDLAALLRDGSFPLAAPGRGALYEMIARPADKAGLAFEDGLIDCILGDTGDDPGALALMAYLLDELYKACQRDSSEVLTHAAYEALGGVRGAIGTRAQNVFEALDDEAQAALPVVFCDLVSVDERGTATRQRAAMAQFGDKPGALRLINELTGGRLLIQSQGDDHQPVVEVAHEALLRSWPKLVEWIENTQDDLRLLRQVTLAAEEWAEQGHAPAFLWPDERLNLVYAMISRLHPTLNETILDFTRPEAERLLAEIENPNTTHQRRSIIGERLCVVGDPRTGVGLRADGLPDIVWRLVPGGKVTLKGNAGTFEVQPFYIAKYPITYVQFQVFLDDPGGFDNEQWWENLIKNALNEQRFRFRNYPRESVTWYSAMAYCRWLSAKLPREDWMEVRGIVRLPTEWEWQQAAIGGDLAKVYPWGDEWDSSRANTYEGGLNRTTAVGMYPQGKAACGALDMRGNVWEWCLNDYNKPTIVEANITSDRRACRGGSWYNNQFYAQGASRDDYFHSNDQFNSLGLRPVYGATLT